jgi:hypothetical protein
MKPIKENYQGQRAIVSNVSFVGWALPTKMQPVFIEKAGNARPTNLRF